MILPNCSLSDWLENKQLRKLIVAIADIETKRPVERWQFDIETEEIIEQNGYFHIVCCISLLGKFRENTVNL